MTPTMWKSFLSMLGLGGQTRVVDIPGHALVAAMIIKRSREQNKVKRGKTA